VGDAAPLQVAIVDDDTAVRDSLRFLLEVAGHAVAAFASAAEFLSAAARPFVCLIVDQHMPQMTGLDLVARLRQEGEIMPILLLTGAPSPAIIARAAALGVAQVLEKPASGDALLDFVSSATR
jgi:two-component system, LuxR family, response regulator FixJ